jgi:hypothetical protein
MPGFSYYNAQVEPQARSTVYYPASTPLYLSADDSPLYLEWLVEGADGILYIVPAERGGWRKRQEYTGARNSLKRVNSDKAHLIISLLCAQAPPSEDYAQPQRATYYHGAP